MSIMAGRSAAAEGAYFLQESKQAVSRILQKNTPKLQKPNININNNNNCSNSKADVLPEVLRHSLPPKMFQQSQPSDPSILLSSKWVLPTTNGGTVSSSYVSPDALNPLKAYVSLPQVTFGPKRWQLPESQSSVLASTANELRRDKYTPVNPEKLKAAALGVTQRLKLFIQRYDAENRFLASVNFIKLRNRVANVIVVDGNSTTVAKAFAAATVIIFGSATLVLGTAVSKLDLHNGDDVKTKGKDLVQPKLEMVKGKLIPLKNWAEETSEKWHLDRDKNIKEKPLVKEFNKILWAKTSN